MLKRFENKLLMFLAVLRFMKQNQEKWESSPAITALMGELEILVSEIETTRQVADMDRTGITAQKNEQQEMVIEKAYELLSAVFAMASQTNNKELAGKVDFTESDLQNSRGSDLVATGRSIAAIVREHLRDLGDYEITEADIAELEEKIAQFSENLPSNRISVGERKAANEKLKELFGNGNILLEDRLDRLMVKFKSGNPEFFTAYENARIIVDYGIRHNKEDEPAGEEG